MDLKWVQIGRWKGHLVGAVALVAVLVSGFGALWVQTRTPEQVGFSGSVSASVNYISLPVQGQRVMEQIRRGGPFRYEKDGTVFGNRERLLPAKKRGYYREYTVPTPGLNHRGARRIVCGGRESRAPDACYYTEDHYASFRLIVQ